MLWDRPHVLHKCWHMRCADTGSECIFIVPFSVSCSIIFGRQNLPSAMAKTDRQNVPHFKFTTLLECKFAATRNYWMIKIKSSQIQWIPTEYNKWHIQGILKNIGKNTTLLIFLLFPRRSHFQNSWIVFHHDFQTLENTNNARPRRPYAFICFSFSCLEIVMKHSQSFLKQY